MKNRLLLLILMVSSGSLQAQSNWNLGIQTGCVTNLSIYDSGNEEANALFTNNQYKSMQLGIIARYKISEKFSIQSGMNFTEFGFSYGMAKNYSLKKPFERSSDISSSTCITSLPAMFVLNTPKNCSNVRFIFGLGLAVRGIDAQWDNQDQAEIPANEGANSKTTMMTAESRTVNELSGAATWMIGMEKVLRKGNTMSFTFQGNQGFSTIAESTVSYTANDQFYTHTFINRGSYATFAFAYNFSTFGTRKANKLIAK